MSLNQNMLTEEVQKMCLGDPELLAKVAVACGKSTIAALRMVERNQSKELATVYVLRVIADYTGKSEEQILINESSHN